MANWHKIWKDAISGNSRLQRNRVDGEMHFEQLLKKYGDDGMIFWEWALAYDTIGEKSLALEKFKMAKEKLPLEHWKERAQFGIDRIENNSLEKYPCQIHAMYELHSYLYSKNEQEQELKYLLISSLPNVEVETASTLIYFRVALESFLDAIAQYSEIKLDYNLCDDIDFVCTKFRFSIKIKDAMHRIRKAGNAKIHANLSEEDKKLAKYIKARIEDFLEIVRFYKSESEIHKLIK